MHPRQRSSPAPSGEHLLTIVRAQIIFLLSTVTQDNFEKNASDIDKLVQTNGIEANIHFVRRLIIAASPSPHPSSSKPPHHLLLRFLSREVLRLSRDTSNVSVLVQAVHSGLKDPAAFVHDAFANFDYASVADSLPPLSLLVYAAALSERVPDVHPVFNERLRPNVFLPLASDALSRLRADSQPLFDASIDNLASIAALVYSSVGPEAVSRLFEHFRTDSERLTNIVKAFITALPDSEVFNERQPFEFLLPFANLGLLGPESLVSSNSQEDAQPPNTPSDSSVYDVALDRMQSRNGTPSDYLNQMLVDLLTRPASSALASPSSSAASTQTTTGLPTALDMPALTRAIVCHKVAPDWPLLVRHWDHDDGVRLPPINLLAAFIQSDTEGHLYDAIFVDLPFSESGSTSSDPSGPLHARFRLIEALLQLGPDRLDTSNLQKPKVVSPDQAADLPPEHSVQALIRSPLRLSTIWNIVPTTHAALRDPRARRLLDRGLATFPELVLPALVGPNKPQPLSSGHEDPTLREARELADDMIPLFIHGSHPASLLALYRVLSLDLPLLLNHLQRVYTNGEDALPRVLDVAAELSILDDLFKLVCSRPNARFALDLAAAASRRGLLDLESWLIEKFKHAKPVSGVNNNNQQSRDDPQPNFENDTGEKAESEGVPHENIKSNAQSEDDALLNNLVSKVLDFVGYKVKYDLERLDVKDPPRATTVSLSVNAVATFMRVLRTNTSYSLFTPSDVEHYKEVRTQCLQLHPRLINFLPSANSDADMHPARFSAATEAEVDSLYKKYYDLELQLPSIISILSGARSSDDPSHCDLFSCFLHSLFEEARFFPTYPPKELTLTASLFGELIQNDLIEGIPLGIAVRYVLDALRNSPNSPWFSFGLGAFERFHGRLREWPQLASTLLNIPHLHIAAPQVATFAKNALLNPKRPDETPQQPRDQIAERGEETEGVVEKDALDNAHSTAFLPLPQFQPFTAISINIDSEMRMVGNMATAPDEETSDNILFHINNLSPANIDEKSEELSDKLWVISSRERNTSVVNDSASEEKGVEDERKSDGKLPHAMEQKFPKNPDLVLVRWLAAYLVSERVSLEPNNHPLYLSLVEKLHSASLSKCILLETYLKSAQLLNSEKTVSSSNERALLKNLGAWLGLITLAQDKPMIHRHIVLKNVLIQGFDAQRLIVAIPFVCKILEHASHSTVFKPPNPWLMAILKLLVELYHYAQLKLNLKFEIEVLFKALELDLDGVQPTNVVRSRPSKSNDDPSSQATKSRGTEMLQGKTAQIQQQPQSQGTSEGRMELAGGKEQQPPADPTRPLYQQMPLRNAASMPLPGPTQQVQTTAAHAQDQQPSQDIISAASQDLHAYVTVNQSVFNFFQGSSIQPARLRHGVQLSIDRAIREVSGPFVDRSVTIAVVSTRDLILKDFACEGDEEKMKHAAHLMAQNLASTLAKVTCKELLRNAITTNLGQMFSSIIADLGHQKNSSNIQVPETAIALTATDNLDMACTVVDRVAMEKASAEVDEALSQAYLARRKHRERNPKHAYWDPVALNYSGALPDPLRLRTPGLDHRQFSVYEAFARPSPTAQNFSSNVQPTSVQQQQINRLTTESPGESQLPQNVQQEAVRTPAHNFSQPHASQNREVILEAEQRALDGAAQGLSSTREDSAAGLPYTSPQQAIEKFGAYLEDLDKYLKSDALSSITTLPPDHDIHVALAQISLTAERSATRDETTFACTQKVVQRLFKAESSLARDVYATLIEKLCIISPKVAQEVNAWFVYADDPRKRNVPAVVTLLLHQLIVPVEYDAQAAKMLLTMDDSQGQYQQSPSTNHLGFQDFIARLLSVVLAPDSPFASRHQFSRCLEALVKLADEGKASETVKQLLKELKYTPGDEGTSSQVKDELSQARLREQLTYCFSEWLSIFQNSFRVEDSFVKFVVELQSQGVLKGEEISSLFFRVCTEASLESYIKQKAKGITANIFQPVDAFAKLITFMIKYHAPTVPGAENMTKAKVHYLTKILSIVVLVLAQTHEELGTSFPQKPFFRFFSSLLANLRSIEGQLGTAYNQIIISMSHSLITLQPAYFPGFAFSWVSLISHRLFMPKLLQMKGKEGWPWFHRLLYSLLRFITPALSKGNMLETTRTFYAGTLKILLVLLHDFPSFLSFYTPSLLDVIPDNCVQLTNLVCSAYPPEDFQTLPDPFTTDLNTESIPHMKSLMPTFDYAQTLQRLSSKVSANVSQALNEPKAFLEALQPGCMGDISTQVVGSDQLKYDVLLLRNIVGFAANIPAQEQPGEFDPESPSTKFFMFLIEQMDFQGRYHLFCAMTNNLRFPSTLTYYFAQFVIYAFKSVDADVKQLIVRVLLERIIAAKPHPWGVVAVFVNLAKDESHDFYNYDFVRCAPEIEKLFEVVKKSIEEGNDGELSNA